MSRLIRIRQLREMLGHSNATIYRLIKNAGLPPPIKITSRTSAWDENAIASWISKKTGLPKGTCSHDCHATNGISPTDPHVPTEQEGRDEQR